MTGAEPKRKPLPGPACSRRTGKKEVPDPVDLHVGKRLRLRRTILGLTQEKLASSLGISFQQVQKYEEGFNRISASRLYDLSLALRVDIQFFYDDLDEALVEDRPAPFMGRASEPTDILKKSETLDLVRCFWRLPSQETRQLISALLASMVRDG